MFLFVLSLLKEKPLPYFWRQLLASVVTELAGYDPVVAIELANREMPDFFNPKNVLLAVSD